MIGPEGEPFWHSPEMVGALWTVITALSGSVTWFFRNWKADRKRIETLEAQVKALDNGITFAMLRAQHQEIHTWWENHIRDMEERNR